MKTLYLDCFSGISGDMFIGALIDAGADPIHLREELSKLHIEDEYELKWEKIIKNGITCTKFDVILLEDKKKDAHNHAHRHNDLVDGQSDKHEAHDHGHTHEHSHTHEHHDHRRTHEHAHTNDHHDHSHTHAHEHHHHDHRSYKDIVRLIEAAGLSERVEKTALQIFKKIGEAEGLIHGIPLERVHFHEVGAVDSIIDIVGAAILIHQLGIDTVKSSPVPVGKGKIRIDHGIYPVPAPATLEMLRGIPLEQSDIRAELTTPTGAAIIAVLAEEFGSIPSMNIQSIGYGAGTKTFPDQPNALRVIIGE
ncbi:LarC family nickel insertion protein [Paenibacillus sp. Marseille-Q4541]|uniref:LarC family nickel insertion protein n=1 Tax=Paenibacillus sp. Marseille-Q4541 TaxID=2831522 RepID=UPI001BA8239A|nr:LarC family nickel insertion protein [Paenibacillus sp. Marseille-Q4541]